MKRLVFVLACLFLVAGTANAQTRTITGKVTDAEQRPMAFVTVAIKGTNLGTLTKEDGSFLLQVPTKAKIGRAHV